MCPEFIFLLILTVEIVVDLMREKTRACMRTTSPHVLALILIHHAMNVFLLFGWLFRSPLLRYAHIATVVGVAIHWKTNGNRCELTRYVNRACGWNYDEPFYDLLAFTGVKQLPYWRTHIHYLVIFVALGLSLMKTKKITRTDI